MNRRFLLQTSVLATAGLSTPRAALMRQVPGATPEPGYFPEDQPVDTRARVLITRLSSLSPLTVLEALETGIVREETLVAAGAGAPVKARSWNDPGDTDLEHALGGVLIAASDDPVNSPDMVMLGAYIVFESAEIAYDQLMRQLEEIGDQGSMTVAGTKAWMASSEGMSLAILRLGYVLIIAGGPVDAPDVTEGLINHLNAISADMS